MRQTIKSFGHSLNSMLWPARCISCGELVDEGMPLCNVCFTGLRAACDENYCHRCGGYISEESAKAGRCGFCMDKKLHIDGFARAGRYESTLRNLVLSLKRSENAALLQFVSILAKGAYQSRFADERIDLIVPVPLYWTRRARRGFNQADILAKSICSDDIAIGKILRRCKKTKPQPVMTSYSQRQKNVKGAFVLRRKVDLHGKRICLVDDVRTSGATINECARVLKDAGAEKVYGFALAVPGSG